MSEQQHPDDQRPDQQRPDQHRPDQHRRDRTRPLELLGISAAAGLFIGLLVLVSTREFDTALIFAGVAFILTLVVVAMLLLATTPRDTGAPDDDEAGPPAH